MSKQYSMAMIRQANRNAGAHWFDSNTLRFFSSRFGELVFQGPGGIFFVSSEKQDSHKPRLYTIRQFDPDTGAIATVGEFQQYASSGRARRVAARRATTSEE